MGRVEDAVSSFREGYTCSQAIVSTYGPEMGLDKETALRISCPFGGGIGRRGETCGTLMGAFMVIGLKFGSNKPKDEENKEKSFRVLNDVAEKFISRQGSVLCRDLLGVDLSTSEGLEYARENKLFSTICPQYVECAAEILEETL